MGVVSRQSSAFLAGTIFTAAAGYLFKVYLARSLGAETLGIYALGMTLVSVFGGFNGLGLPKAAVRFVATYCATGNMELLRGFLARGTLLLLAANVVFAGGLLVVGPWVAVRFYHAPELKQHLEWFAAIMSLMVLNTFLGEVLVGYKNVGRRIVISNFVGSPTMMVFTVALVWLGWELRGYLLAQVVSALLVLVLMLTSAWRMTPQPARSLSPPWPPIQKEVVSFSAAVLGLSTLSLLMSQADKVIVGFYLDPRQLGVYAVAMGMAAFVPVILQAINQIFSPTIADLCARQQRQMLERIFQTLTKWCIGLTVPLAGVMIMFAPALMRIFGRDFETGWPILIIGTIGQLVNCAVGSVGTLLLMSGNQSRLVRIQVVMAGVMVVLNLALVPRWGIIGAATAAALTNAFANLWYLAEVHRHLRLFPYGQGMRRLILPIAGTALVLTGARSMLSWSRPEWIAPAVALVLSYLAFAGIALLFGLDDDDRIILRAARSKIENMFRKPGAIA
jgi:O-antigen/teichoic acid export membrane protein